MADLVEIVDNKLRLNLHPGQTRAWESQKRYVFVIAAAQSGKCVAPDTLVIMADGTRKRIADIVPGDSVLAMSDDLQIVADTVTASFSTGVQPLYEIVTATGRRIQVTAEHPLYGRTGWRPAGEFMEGDFIGVPRGYPQLGNAKAPASEMRLLGYLLGDGGLTSSSVIFSNVDPAILTDIARCLPADHEIAHYDRCSYRIRRRGGRAANRDAVNGMFKPATAESVLGMCDRWGIRGKLAREKQIPEFVFGLDCTALAPMIQALFDCDATVDAKGIEICLASEAMIDDLQHLLLRFGIVARKRYKLSRCNDKEFDAWRLTFSDLDALLTYRREIGFVGDKLARLDALIQRKGTNRPNGKDVVANFPLADCWDVLGSPEPSRQGGHRDQVGHELLRGTRRAAVARAYAQRLAEHFAVGQQEANSAIFWDTIRSIVPIGPLPTWDITVAQGHNFIAQDIFAHNTSFGKLLFYKWIQELGPGDYLAVTATYDLFKLKMLPEMLRFFCETLKWGNYVASDRIILSNDCESRIILRSASSPGGLESATVKAAWLDECGQDDFTLDAWEAIQRRLALAQGRVLGTTTPYNLGWLKTEVYDRWAAGDPDYDVIQFKSTDNPAFPVAEYERMRATLPPWKFEMFCHGSFARPGGLIYEDFNTDLHRINLPYIAPYWPIYVGVDFGAVHTAQVWLAEEPGTHRLFVFRETLTGGRSTPEHAQLAKINAAPFRYVKWYGGAAGEDQQRMDWTRAGIPIQRPPVTDVEAQIDRVIGLFRQNRLYIGKGLSGLVNELTTYSRELDAHGQPTEKIANKAAFHRLDALRYVVAGLTRGQTRARSSEY